MARYIKHTFAQIAKFTFLPYFYAKDTLKSFKKKQRLPTLGNLAATLIIFCTWSLGYFVAGVVAYQGLKQTVFKGSEVLSAQTVPVATKSFTPLFTSKPSQIKGVNTQTSKPTNSGEGLVTCNFTYLPDKQMTLSECNKSFECGIGGQWYIYTDRNKCAEDQKKDTPTAYPAFTPPPTYPPCTVFYPALGYSQTYVNVLTSQCDLWKQQANSYATPTPYVQPTMSPEEQQALINQHNSQVDRCQHDIVNNYAPLIQGCNQYGDSSAAEACKTIYERNRQKEYDACGQKI